MNGGLGERLYCGVESTYLLEIVNINTEIDLYKVCFMCS